MSRPAANGHRQPTSRKAVGSNPIIVWAIKHIVSPIDRLVLKVGRGRIPPPSSRFVPTLLLTTVGRRSGQERTIPLVFVCDDDRYVVANARPAGERRNPWVANLRAAGRGRVQQRGQTVEVIARELDGDELQEWWPKIVDVWPAFADHYANTGERTMFSLEPATTNENENKEVSE